MTQSTGVGRHPPSRRTHGHSFVDGRATPEYQAWSSMKRRCLNPSSPNWPLYGGRGITVCQEWVNSFGTFLADLGLRPAPNYSLERIDNAAGYAPANCKWALLKPAGGSAFPAHVDHVEPVVRIYTTGFTADGSTPSRPELHREDNWFPSCAPCNIDKSAMSIEAWRVHLGKKLGIAMRQARYRLLVAYDLLRPTHQPVTFYFERALRSTVKASSEGGGDE